MRIGVVGTSHFRTGWSPKNRFAITQQQAKFNDQEEGRGSQSQTKNTYMMFGVMQGRKKLISPGLSMIIITGWVEWMHQIKE
eukprot:7091580-Ditylum_brightwellii.AAC.1